MTATRKFLSDLWRRERPSRARAARKDAIREAQWHLERWADYGNRQEWDWASSILTQALVGSLSVSHPEPTEEER